MSRPRKGDKHLPPCVYFKHGAYWYVKRGKWERIGTELAEALAAYASKIETPAGGMAELIDRVLAAHAKHISANTLAQYKIAAGALKSVFREFAPEQVKPKHIAAFKLAGVDTPNMTNRKLSFLRLVFDYAVEWQELDANPCVGIKRLAEAKRSRYLTDDEFAAIRAQAGPRLQVIMDLLFLTGQRIDDVLKLRRADVTAEGLHFQQRKTGAKVCVAWSPDLRAAVQQAQTLHTSEASPYLLPARDRRKAPDYKSVLDQWHVARLAAGVHDATPHDIRAKSATDADADGLNATKLLGHTSPSQTTRYIRGRKAVPVDGPSIRQVLDVGQKQ